MEQAAKIKKVPEIPDYEIISKIGQGGIARVYKARQKSLNRNVAIKILSPDLVNDSDIVRRFDRESMTIARLSHQNIVHIIDRGKVDNQCYFIMEFINGTSYKEIITSEKHTVKQKLGIIVMVLKGIDYAHKNGVIHRDVKPANILVDGEGNVRVADFGIAQILNTSDQEMTRSDVVMGTLAYMSPEQRVSSHNVDNTTDIYSVGIMLYEILTGRRPSAPYLPPSQVNSKIDKEFDDIVVRCLDIEPKERYQSAVELKDDILNVISGRSGREVTHKSNISGVESFIGKCQFLDTIKETKYSTTSLVENRESRELLIIKKNEKSPAGLKEARILAKLKHENIINIFGAGGDSRRLVVVMEYAQGGSLADRMVKTYPVEKALAIIKSIINGLDFAHKNDVIHGNLRPSNVLFNREEAIKLTDFGLPPHYDLMKKNWYAPPEKRVSKQADIYALGVILYNLLFGKNPAYDRNGGLLVNKYDFSISLGIGSILRKLLAFKIANRYQDIEELMVDWKSLEMNMHDSEVIERHGTVKKRSLFKTVFKNPKVVIIAIVGIVIIVTAIIIFSSKF